MKKYMNRETFYQELRHLVYERLSLPQEDVNITLRSVARRNQGDTDAFLVEKKNDSMAHFVYLDRAYDYFFNGGDIEEVADRIAKEIEEAKPPELDPDDIMHYDRIRDKLTFHLVERQSNEEYLSNKVWEPLGDFAQVVFVVLEETDGRGSQIAVTEGYRESLKVSRRQILEDTRDNLDREHPVFEKLIDFMLSRVPEGMELPEKLPEEEDPLYILTTPSGRHGAAMLSRKDVLEDIGEQLGGDYYVLPSSVHEVLILKGQDRDLTELSDMVKNVNATEVEAEDFLSNCVQFFDHERGELCNAEKYFAEKEKQREEDWVK